MTSRIMAVGGAVPSRPAVLSCRAAGAGALDFLPLVPSRMLHRHCWTNVTLASIRMVANQPQAAAPGTPAR